MTAELTLQLLGVAAYVALPNLFGDGNLGLGNIVIRRMLVRACWEGWMGTHLSSLGAASTLFLAFVSPALAAPVTSADLEGKKICWENSLGKNVATYGPGDKYSSTTNGKGTWSITKLGVEVHVDGNFPYQRYAEEKLPDGTLTSQLLYPTGLDLRSTGKYCK